MNERLPKEFIHPSMKHEVGEFERVKDHFNIKSKDFIDTFKNRVTGTPLTELSDDLWNNLENTDSTDIKFNGWIEVAYHTRGSRDWEDLKNKMSDGTPVDAPIIAKTTNKLHLVSGNTRLMVSKALGITPQVVIVDISDLVE